MAGAYGYLQALLAHLNGTAAFTNRVARQTLLLLPAQQGEGQTDSSVAPFALRTTFPPAFASNYNFALARVRLRGVLRILGCGGQRAGVLPRLRQPESRTPTTRLSARTPRSPTPPGIRERHCRGPG